MKTLTTRTKLLPVAFAGMLALTACDAGFSTTKDDSDKKTTVTVEQTTPSSDASKADEDSSNGGPNPTGTQETETSTPESDTGSPTAPQNPESGQAPDAAAPMAPSKP